MSSVLNVAYTLTREPPEVAGWPHHLENGSTIYFHESGVGVIQDLLDSLELKQNIYFGYYEDAFHLITNGTADIGSMLTSIDDGMIQLGFGTKSYVFFRQPLSENLRITMLRPFTPDTWFVYLSFILVMAISAELRGTNWHQCNHADFLINAIRLIIGRLQVGQTATMTSWKIANLVMSLFSVLMLSMYTANVVSVFASSDELVKTPEDIIKHHYKLHSYSPFHIDRLFPNLQTNNLEVRKVTQINAYLTIQRLVGKYKSDPREALFTHPDGFYPQAMFGLKYEQELCVVSNFKSETTTPRSFYIRKDSPFREKINLKILHLIERGLNYRHVMRFRKKLEFNCPNQAGKKSPLSLQHSLFAFAFLLVGLGVATLLNCADVIGIGEEVV